MLSVVVRRDMHGAAAATRRRDAGGLAERAADAADASPGDGK